MSSLMPTKRDYSPNRLPDKKGLLDWLLPFVSSSVGGKITVAVTGLGLTGFVVVHLIGNLKLFAGRDAINSYAEFLKSWGVVLWIARFGLLLFFLLHIATAVRLRKRAREARPIPYQRPATIQATLASRTMLATGVAILVFVLFHLAHYTFGWLATTTATELGTGAKVTANYLSLVDASGRHDVYSMVVAGFRNPLIGLLYIVGQIALLTHLSHGISSTFQTLGLNAPRFQPTVKIAGYGLAAAIAFGNSLIVVAVWVGWIPIFETYVAAGMRS